MGEPGGGPSPKKESVDLIVNNNSIIIKKEIAHGPKVGGG